MLTEDLVRVFAVSSGPVAGGLQQYVVTANLVARPDICLQMQTINPYAASLCQRAKDLDRPIAVTHESTKYGETLRGAHFLKIEGAA